MNDRSDVSDQKPGMAAIGPPPAKKRGMIGWRKPPRPPGPPLTTPQAVFVRSGKVVLGIGFGLGLMGVFAFAISTRGHNLFFIGLPLIGVGLLFAVVSGLIRKAGTRFTGAPPEEDS